VTPTPVPPTPVPPAGATTPAPAGAACTNPYTVKQGDWIYKIARDCKVEPSAIIAVNPGINPNFIKPGQQLNMPTPGATPVPPATSQAQACSGTYTVKSGNNLFRIAYNCGLTTEQMAAANGIKFPYTIYPGQVLKYP
jgi:LysM repeat protein